MLTETMTMTMRKVMRMKTGVGKTAITTRALSELRPHSYRG